MRVIAGWVGLLVALASGAARAENLWDGKWELVPSQSHAVAHTLTLEKLSNGMWRYDDGYEIYVLDPSGRAFPEPLNPAEAVVTRKLSNHDLSFDEVVKGVVDWRTDLSLSQDGERLEGSSASIDKNGKWHTRKVVDIRVGPGRGLEGRWREPAEAAAAPSASESKVAPNATEPYWVISSVPSGLMTWTIPRTGEVLTGKADGKPYVMRGPLKPDGLTFTFVRLSPRHLVFSAFERGRLVEQTSDMLSSDDKRWTEWIWAAAYPEEKDLRTFVRR